MRIGIDITGLGARREGIVSYTWNLTAALLELSTEHEFFLYRRVGVEEFSDRVDMRIHVRDVKSSNRKIAQQVMLPPVAKKDRLDVLFFPFNSAGLFYGGRSVVTIHDLQPYVLPQQFAAIHDRAVYQSEIKAKINHLYWRWMLRRASVSADRVIAVSQATKRDLEQIFKLSSNRIDVVYEGVDHDYFNLENDGWSRQAFLQQHGLPDNYILCLGLNAYKNIEGAVRAYGIARDRLPEGCKLVLAGKNYLGDRLTSMIAEDGLDGDIILTGYFPGEQLKYLYRFADVFLFPSFYEGFGLPVLEAFACGTPVVTSATRGSLSEIAGDAALLADPMEPAAIAEALVDLYSDEDARHQLVQKGLSRSREFSWRRAAEGTLAVLEQTVRDAGGK